MSDKLYKNKAWLEEMFNVKELEVWEIAELSGTNVKMIHEWLNRFDLYVMDEPEFVDEFDTPANLKKFL